MPQMSPLMWLMLFFIFIFIFLMFNILNFFNYSIKMKKNSFEILEKTFKQMNWKW